jgi:hypothetical protein
MQRRTKVFMAGGVVLVLGLGALGYVGWRHSQSSAEDTAARRAAAGLARAWPTKQLSSVAWLDTTGAARLREELWGLAERAHGATERPR